MSTVGDTLRRERLRKEISLEQISRETKIAARLLDAIENDRFDRLPGGVFAKSFVRQYARYLRLDEEELAAEVQKAIQPEIILTSVNGALPEPAAFKVPKVAEWEGGGSRDSSSILPALAMVVAVTLVCSGIYGWWQRSRRPPAQPPASTVAAPTSTAKSPPSAPVTTGVTRNPEAGTAQTRTGETDRQTPSEANLSSSEETPPGPLHMSLMAAEDTWVQVWADGKIVIIGTLPANTAKTVDAANHIRVRTGNAGGLQVTLNGKPAGLLGSHGQVRIVDGTAKGVQILVPPKPAPVPAPAPAPGPF